MMEEPMRDSPEGELKKAAAWKLTTAFLDGVSAETMFADRADRGMAVAMAVMRFIVREAIEPGVYLNWLAKVADLSIVAAETQEQADLFAEARRTEIWH
jgi:hypothetical protein